MDFCHNGLPACPVGESLLSLPNDGLRVIGVLYVLLFRVAGDMLRGVGE